MNTIENIDCIEGMKAMPDQSVDCCVTSPPYFGLMDYGHDGQIGLEETPEKYVAKMVEVFTEVKRVLKKEGTLWLNLGDSYASGARDRTEEQATRNSNLNGGLKTQMQSLKQPNKITAGLKAKDLIGIPWAVAFALRSDGWYLRQDIIWHKPNPMPESVTDRCTKSHEYVFLLSKSGKYYYNQEASLLATEVLERLKKNNQVDIPAGFMDKVKAYRKKYEELKKASDKAEVALEEHENSWDDISGGLKIYASDSIPRIIQKAKEANIPTHTQIRDKILLKGLFIKDEDMETFVQKVMMDFVKRKTALK